MAHRPHALLRSCSLLLFLCLAAAPVTAGDGVWTSVGPYGGSIYDLEIAPSNPRILYAAAASGVYKSRNGGRTWQLASQGLPILRYAHLAPYELAVDPRNASTVYAIAPLEGLYKTTDGGARWSLISSELSYGSTLVVDPHRSSTVYVATEASGVIKSTDGGVTWSLTSPDFYLRNLVSMAVDPHRPSTLYVSYYGYPHESHVGVYKSTDGGRTWTAKNNGLLWTQNAAFFWVAVDPVTPDTLYAASGSEREVLFKSTDGGDSWSEVGPGGYPVATSATGAVYTMRSRSLDGGATWRETALPPGEGPIQLVAHPRSPATVFAVRHGQGIFRSEDGALTWQPAHQGIAATNIDSLAIDPEDSTVYARAWGVGLFRSPSGGGAWQQVPLPEDRENPARWIELVEDGTFYAGSQLYPGFWRRSGEGAPWEPRDLPGEYPLSIVDDFVVAPDSSDRLYLGVCPDVYSYSDCQSFRSVDGGRSWIPLSLPGRLRFFIPPSSPPVVYAANQGNGRFFKSLDRGVTWSRIDQPGFPRRITHMAFNVDHPEILFAGTSRGLFKSRNGGRTWAPASQGLPPNPMIAELVIDPEDGARLYAMTVDTTWGSSRSFSLYRSRDGGRSWRRLEEGLPQGALLLPYYYEYLPHPRLVIDPNNPRDLYVATPWQGVYKITVEP